MKVLGNELLLDGCDGDLGRRRPRRGGGLGSLGMGGKSERCGGADGGEDARDDEERTALQAAEKFRGGCSHGEFDRER